VVSSRGGVGVNVRSQCYSARNQVWAPDSSALLFSGAMLGPGGQTGVADWWVVRLVQGQPRQSPIRTFAAAELYSAGIEGKAVPEAWDKDWLYVSVPASRREFGEFRF
jgi:hypothetical protein